MLTTNATVAARVAPAEITGEQALDILGSLGFFDESVLFCSLQFTESQLPIFQDAVLKAGKNTVEESLVSLLSKPARKEADAQFEKLDSWSLEDEITEIINGEVYSRMTVERENIGANAPSWAIGETVVRFEEFRLKFDCKDCEALPLKFNRYVDRGGRSVYWTARLVADLIVGSSDDCQVTYEITQD